jgi:hypothetical protein
MAGRKVLKAKSRWVRSPLYPATPAMKSASQPCPQQTELTKSKRAEKPFIMMVTFLSLTMGAFATGGGNLKVGLF